MDSHRAWVASRQGRHGRMTLTTKHADIDVQTTAGDGTFEYLEAAAQAFDRAPLAMALIDMTGHCIWVNEAAEHIFGYSTSDLAGRALSEFGVPDEPDDDAVLFAEAAAGRIAAWERVKQVHTRDRLTWIHARYWVIPAEPGRPSFVVTQVARLTARQAALHDAVRHLAEAAALSAGARAGEDEPIAEAAATILATETDQRGAQASSHVFERLLPGWPPATAAPGAEIAEEVALESPSSADAFTVTLYEAAQLLNVSGSTLRRWADSGRVGCARTAGGHRRFRLADIQRLRSERRRPSEVRRQEYPARPLPFVAATLERHAPELAGRIARCLYIGPPGWFETPEATAPIRALLGTLARAFATGEFHDTQGAVRQLMHRAELGGASLAERHGFIQTYDAILRRQLRELGCPRVELAGAAQTASAMTYQLVADYDRELSGR